ncbi:Hypothetical protein R9X50_00677500 [Acrodontium crateriforme]|uniref:Uncharacterized protein n=1 Tax=Acrodontium crateriforme TaxID=150365 RepID=A0AAQ3MAE9_9PEZI|nr:Hypothetical protein R9X50_00677500 [Acrodontium crateriforme]
MSKDVENGYSEPEIVSSTPPQQRLPQRPLTAEEKLAATTHKQRYINSSGSSSQQEQEQEHYNGQIVNSTGFLGKLRHFEAALDKKLGVESEAIDRKLPEDRTRPTWHNQLNMALLWASGTMNLSCFASGFLGPASFGLSLKQSIVIVIFASLLGAGISGFTATFGAPMGLRQISVGRYSMGWYPNKICAALNAIQQLGWSATGCITGGIALQAVSNNHISISVGIVIIAVISLLVSTLGLRAILVYEKYAWFIYLVIFIIILAETGRYADNTSPAKSSGADLSANVLNLLAVVYGSSASWATLASDYYVHYPVNVNRVKVFFMTTFGIAIPTSIGMVSGAVVASALNNRPDWNAEYNNSIGFLIQTMLYPRGFAKFILVLLVLSGINLNIINTYSAAISCQQFARPFALIPRFIWTIICFGVVIALSLAGKDHLLAYLENFLSLLGYWCTSYFVIVFTEHFVFRKADFNNYDLDGWNDPARLPLGIAAMTAFCFGVIAWVMGMYETWYVGPLAKLIGGGGDVANEFTLVVTFVTYIPVRYLELNHFGR